MRFATMTAAGLLFALNAFAPAPAAAQGTPEQQQYCANDAMNFCGNYMSDMRAMGQCMRRNAARLSPACRATMSSPRRAKRRRG
jgi:hypothetical protein